MAINGGNPDPVDNSNGDGDEWVCCSCGSVTSDVAHHLRNECPEMNE